MFREVTGEDRNLQALVDASSDLLKACPMISLLRPQQHQPWRYHKSSITVMTPSERNSRASRELVIDYPKQRLQKVTRQQTIPTRLYGRPWKEMENGDWCGGYTSCWQSWLPRWPCLYDEAVVSWYCQKKVFFAPGPIGLKGLALHVFIDSSSCWRQWGSTTATSSLQLQKNPSEAPEV